MGVGGGGGGRVSTVGTGTTVLTTVTTNVTVEVGLGLGEPVGVGSPGAGAGSLGVTGEAVPEGVGWVATGGLGVGVGNGEMGEKKGSSVAVGNGELGEMGENVALGGVLVTVGVAVVMATRGARVGVLANRFVEGEPTGVGSQAASMRTSKSIAGPLFEQRRSIFLTPFPSCSRPRASLYLAPSARAIGRTPGVPSGCYDARAICCSCTTVMQSSEIYGDEATLVIHPIVSPADRSVNPLEANKTWLLGQEGRGVSGTFDSLVPLVV